MWAWRLLSLRVHISLSYCIVFPIEVVEPNFAKPKLICDAKISREAAASENSTSYFPLLDSVANGAFISAPTDEALYETFLRLLREDGHVTSPEALSTLKLALSTRSAAPRIEAHYQYYDTAVKPQLQDSFREGCEQWVALGGVKYCSASLDDGQPWDADSSASLPFDRVLGSGPSAILYADPASPSFAAFHDVLAKKARKGEISYSLRYRRVSKIAHEPLPISGYGVELALKRTDYIVIDDRESSSPEVQKPVDSGMLLDQEEEVADLKPLSTSELAPLGLKAASFIMQNQFPFDTLIKLTQDFPKFSSSISKHGISEEFDKEHKQNRITMVPSGVNVLWMNGVQLIERQIEAFTLVDMLRRERKLINGVRALGLTGKQAVSLLGHRKIASAKSDDEPPRFDWRDDPEGAQVIMWLNNLEEDDQYKEFPTKLTSVSAVTVQAIELGSHLDSSSSGPFPVSSLLFVATSFMSSFPWISPSQKTLAPLRICIAS